jgi:hypothetical protein
MRRDAALAASAAASRAQVAAAPAAERPPLPPEYRFSWRRLPRDIKLIAVGLILVLLLGLGWLFVPWRPTPIPPLLGWSEPTSGRKPTPPPKAKPRPANKKAGKKKGWFPW